MGAKIDRACWKIKGHLRNRQGRPRVPKPLFDYGAWATTWAPEPPPPRGRKAKKPPKPSDLALARDWKQRWKAYNPREGPMGRAANRALRTAFRGGYLSLHKDLRKAENSVLV